MVGRWGYASFIKIGLEFGILDLESTWNLELGILGPLQQSYDFHVVGLWKHIDKAEVLKKISPLREEVEVS